MYANWMVSGVIITAQPEHILSFKWIKIKRTASGDRQVRRGIDENSDLAVRLLP